MTPLLVPNEMCPGGRWGFTTRLPHRSLWQTIRARMLPQAGARVPAGPMRAQADGGTFGLGAFGGATVGRERLKKTAASGGKRRFRDHGRPCAGLASAVTPPRFPCPLPP